MHVVRKDKRLILSGDLKTTLGSKINNAGDPRQNLLELRFIFHALSRKESLMLTVTFLSALVNYHLLSCLL